MSLEWAKKPDNITSRLLVLDSSFNPPTIAHLRILELALAKIEATPVLLISTMNADKGSNDISHRLKLLSVLSYPIATTNVPRFVDKAKIFTQETWFIMGYDTIIRFFDKKYYTDYDSDMKSFFERSGIVLVERGDFVTDIWDRDAMKAAKPYKDKIIVLDKLDGDPISSTLVREMVTNKMDDKLKEMVPENVLQMIYKLEMYK